MSGNFAQTHDARVWDVNITDGQVLKYDASLQRYEAGDDAAGLTPDGPAVLTNKVLIDQTTIFRDEEDPTSQFRLRADDIATATQREYFMPDADGIVTLNEATQTLANKTLVSGTKILTGGGLQHYSVEGASALAGNVVAQLPVVAPPGDTFVMESTGATLTNKTIDDASNIVRATSIATLGAPVVTSTGAAPFKGGLVLRSTGTTTAEFSTPEFAVEDFRLYQEADQTARLKFDISGFPTATTNTFAWPSNNGVVVLESQPQTLTKKTITDVTNLVRATELGTSTTSVGLLTGAAPSPGQVLAAVSGSEAQWSSLPAPLPRRWAFNECLRDVTKINVTAYAPASPDLSPAAIGGWYLPRNATLVAVTVKFFGTTLGATITNGSATFDVGKRVDDDTFTLVANIGAINVGNNGTFSTAFNQAFLAGDTVCIRLTTDATFAWSGGVNNDAWVFAEFEV